MIWRPCAVPTERIFHLQNCTSGHDVQLTSNADVQAALHALAYTASTTTTLVQLTVVVRAVWSDAERVREFRRQAHDERTGARKERKRVPVEALFRRLLPLRYRRCTSRGVCASPLLLGVFLAS